MADPQFFTRSGPFSLAQLAEASGAVLAPGCDGSACFSDVAPLDAAGHADISFLENRRYVEAFAASKAGACIVTPQMAERAPAGMKLLLSPKPYRTYAHIAQMYYPVPAPQEWIAPTSWIDPTATLGESCRVEPGAVIYARAKIGNRCRIGANSVIGEGVVIGDDCIIGNNTSVSHAIVGQRVNLYPGVCIGQDGFGFAMGPPNHLKIPQLGRVIIGNDVEIGANSTIDRGAGPDTIIGDGCMIDNLVQIGHNVQIGRGCVLVSQSGIAGSTHLGDFVALGGQAGIIGHLRIGTGASIAGKSGVIHDVPAGKTVGGSPAVPKAEWIRQCAMITKLGRRKD